MRLGSEKTPIPVRQPRFVTDLRYVTDVGRGKARARAPLAIVVSAPVSRRRGTADKGDRSSTPAEMRAMTELLVELAQNYEKARAKARRKRRPSVLSR